MEKLTKKIVNCETGEETIIELTAEEIAKHNQMEIDRQTKEAEEAAKVAAREALLARLGITADEAKLLLS